MSDYFVDSNTGDDTNDGLTAGTAKAMNAYGAIHPDAWFCNEIAINCSVNCHKKDGWPRLNSNIAASIWCD